MGTRGKDSEVKLYRYTENQAFIQEVSIGLVSSCGINKIDFFFF